MLKILTNNFLKLVIEGYLFKDVENMLQITPKPGEQYGAAGYPIVMAINAGIELLGSLQSEQPYHRKNGREYFCDYWQSGLKNINSEYALIGMDQLVYNLVRHGIAHIYAAKLGIKISKDKPDKHLEIDTIENTLQIDVEAYYSDFKNSYSNYFKPLINQNKLIQQRLDEIIEQYGQDSKKYFEIVYDQNPSYLLKKTMNNLTNPKSNVAAANASIPWSK